MKNAILNLVEEIGDVSFVELCNQVPGFTGNEVASINENIVLWNKVSLDGINALNDLKESGLVVMIKTGPLTYCADGKHLDLPLAQQINRRYKNLHWLPVVFCIGGRHDR